MNKAKLERAERQRYISLINALKTLDAFVLPSVSPDMMHNYEQLRKYLLNLYHVEGIEELVLLEESEQSKQELSKTTNFKS